MSQEHLHIVATDQDLLTIVAADLLKLPAESLQKTLIIFPTRRLASRFSLQLCPQGARLMPSITTLNGFLETIPSREKNVLDARSCELLIGLLLGSKQWRHLQNGLEHEIYQFFKEIEDHKLSEPFSALQKVLREDVYQREEYLDSLAERFQELEELYRIFSEHLQDHHYATQTKAMQKRFELAARGFASQDYRHRFGIERIWLAGFTTMNQVFSSFCKDLLQHSDQHRLYVHEPLALFAMSASPILDMVQGLNRPSERIARVQTLSDMQKHRTAELEVWRAENPLQEVKSVLDSIRTLLQSNPDLKRAEIAIILPTEAPYAAYLYALRKEYEDLRMNLAVALSIGMTHVGMDMERLLDEFFQETARTLADMTAATRMQLIRARLETYCAEAELHWAQDPIQIQAIEQCREFFGLEMHDTLFSSLGIHDIKKLVQLFLQTPVRSVGDPLSGVQVLALDESRHMRFRYIFLLGAVEGAFPKAPPEDFLVDDFFKRRIGLPGWQALQARENTTFQLLLNHTDVLRLSYPAQMGNQETVASRYIEILRGLYALDIFEFTPAFREAAAEVSSVLQPDFKMRERFEAIPAAKIPLFSKRQVSVTDIETLVQCPFQFVLKSWMGRMKKSPEVEIIAKQGQALHKAVEIFFQNLEQRKEDYLQLSEVELSSKLHKELCQGLDLFLPNFPENELLRAQMREFGWMQFLESFQPWVTMILQGSCTVFNEEEFTLNLAMGSTETVQVKGRIDLHLQVGNAHYIFDFKRRGIPLQKEVLVAKKPQLILYAQAIMEKHTDPAPQAVECSYYSFLQGKKQTSLSDQGSRANLNKARLALELEIGKHWADLKTGKVLIDASACGFCELGGVCRKNDP